MNPTVSVIIAFYNRLDFLRLVLAGLERQSFPDFDVIIADDGSSAMTIASLQKAVAESPLRISHLWQEDIGFRKNRILNQAVQQARAEYLIFIDMDCIPHREFIREHVENAAGNFFLSGRRVNLSRKISQKLSPALVASGYLDTHFPALVWDGIFGQSKDVEKGLYLTSPLLRRWVNRKKRGILGCNFSAYKDQILAINGFDERYDAPSFGEDSDVQFRLELNGGSIRTLNQIAIQYHLYHPLQPRPQKNLDLFEQVKKEGKSFTPYGIVRKPV